MSTLDQSIPILCIDDIPHVPHRAFIDTIYNDFGEPKYESYEVRCAICGVVIEYIEEEIQ